MSDNTEVNWLTPAEQCAWRAWLYAGFSVINNIDQDFKTHREMDLLEYHILVQAAEARDGIRVGDMAADIIASPQRTSQRVKQMVDRGHLEIVVDPSDKRARIVKITSNGLNKLEAAAPGHVDSVRNRFFEHLDSDDIELLGKLSKKLLAANA